MTDIRRMNVGLTRAKSSLWILGDSRALVQGEFWRKLIENAKARDRYTNGDILSMFRRPLDKAQLDTSTPATMSEDSDVAMLDAASPTTADPNKEPLSSSLIATKRDTAGGDPKAAYDPGTVAVRSAGPPVIHTSAEKNHNPEVKKRPMDGPDSIQPESKRVS